jgi:hypothetical protein
VRELRTRSELGARGITEDQIRWAVTTGRWTRIVQGVYGRGPASPSLLDIARATALITDGIVHGYVAAELHNFDGVKAGAPQVLVRTSNSSRRPGVYRRDELPTDTRLVAQVRCLSPAATLCEIAATLSDAHWEQALEFCLRKGHVGHDELENWAVGNSAAARRVRRVIKLRGGLEIPPTESLLETLAVQLLRKDPTLPVPIRQFAIYDDHGNFVGRPDLCWPDLGVFLELDGQQHKFQPVYDGRRQTRIAGVTGWRCGRLTWDEVHEYPESTLRELARLLGTCAAVPTTVS